MSDDDLMTLKQACETIFGGAIKTATLRGQVDKGNLTVFRVGRRDFTTPRHLKEMVAKCRVHVSPPGSISTSHETNGSSETVERLSERAALKEMLLGAGLKSTSGANIERPFLRRRPLKQS